MPPTINFNSKLPGSSSSISLNESPNEEINYDSDISEDDHAIAEGDDDEYDDEEDDSSSDNRDAEEDEEEPDEGFSVEVNTLTGNTFNIMIHPSDTVEVLKTRIAFQEGISPADQNILLDSQTGCNNNSTVQELNIDRNSKLTLVTNIASGVPFKTPTQNPALLGNNNGNGELMGGGGGDSSSFKLAPQIKRNYGNNNNNTVNNKHSNGTSSSSLRLPKILTSSSSSSSNNSILDKNSNIVNSCNGVGGAAVNTLHKISQVQIENPLKIDQRPTRRDEREWMKSLFNKVVHQNEEDCLEVEVDRDDDEDDFCESTGARARAHAKIIIDIDSTNNGGGGNSTAAVLPPKIRQQPLEPRVSTRYVGTKYAPQEDGSILVVQGDDGVILIIQKNTGQLLEESETCSDTNNNRRSNGNNRFNFSEGQGQGRSTRDLVKNSGRVGRLGYTKNNYEISDSISGEGSSYRRGRYQQENKLVHDKIKENAVTLEKMRQVRSLMAQQKRERSGNRGDEDDGGGEGDGKGMKVGMGVGGGIKKKLEFPRISGGVVGAAGTKLLGLKTGGVGYKSGGVGGGVGVGGNRKSAGGRRSINSSKMSLNRLIAEIYLQTKRKDRHAFTPGQPPYTDQQLLRYVQLKTAILLDEQTRNKTEPCSKCQLDEDWSFNESAPYLVPTVVMNRFKRLANVRNSKSLDKEENDDEDNYLIKGGTLRRKSMIPVISSSLTSKLPNKYFGNSNQQMKNNQGNGGSNDTDRGGSYIPRLILINRQNETESSGAMRNNSVNSVATTASTISRGSSSSNIRKLNGGGVNNRFSSSSSSGGAGGGNNDKESGYNSKSYYGKRINDDDDFDDDDDETLAVDEDDEGICDTTIIITNRNGGVVGGGGGGSNRGSGGSVRGGRPSYKVYPKIYSTSNSFGRSTSSSSRPGSTSKSSTAKKGSVRCQTCKKKVGIACRYQCRCGLTFCSVHRYPETHECTFDYKTEGRKKLRENNPVVVAPKIQEI